MSSTNKQPRELESAILRVRPTSQVQNALTGSHFVECRFETEQKLVYYTVPFMMSSPFSPAEYKHQLAAMLRSSPYGFNNYIIGPRDQPLFRILSVFDSSPLMF